MNNRTGRGKDDWRAPRGARPLADLVSALVDPIVARKAGMTAGLLGAWPEIAGLRLQEGCRPEKLHWSKGSGADDGSFEPATLVVACEGAYVLRLQHESRELIARVNAFFGYPAVSKLKIVQRPVRIERPNRKVPIRPLTAGNRAEIAEATARIESPRLKAALERFGESIIGRNAARPGQPED
ncbi:DUF721 domain-containing protein [Aureimonas sp. AU12]|uniref:DUF721 domain-containing protein n=1 Tax=Aureimonas sp. AU12 TaxID=1638161 RepID=UPI00078193B0|nr:DciA family protein [Aureimonas sp. AU12]